MVLRRTLHRPVYFIVTLIFAERILVLEYSKSRLAAWFYVRVDPLVIIGLN